MTTPSQSNDLKRRKTRKGKGQPTNPDREESLDRTIESTFPASDPPSSIPDPEPKLPRNDGSRDGRQGP